MALLAKPGLGMSQSTPSLRLNIPEETHHMALQRALGQRDRGGPHEQTMSKPQRLAMTRSGEITHSSLHEPLTAWKSLESHNPRWPSTWRRYHLNHGIRVVDHDTVVVSARDKVQMTPNGLFRSSTGSVTYSHTQKNKAELEVQELAHILLNGPPGSSQLWTPEKLERLFKERTGRCGVWGHYDIGLRAFLLCFPKTFELYGTNHEFVRLKRARSTRILDNVEEAMTRLARARVHGYVQQHATVPGQVTTTTNPHVELHADGRMTQMSLDSKLQLPTLKSNRFKVAFKPYADDDRVVDV